MNDTATLYLPDDKLREQIAAAQGLLGRYATAVHELVSARRAFMAAEEEVARIEAEMKPFGLDPVTLVYGPGKGEAPAFPPVTPAPASAAPASAEPVVTPEDAALVLVYDQMTEELDRPAGASLECRKCGAPIPREEGTSFTCGGCTLPPVVVGTAADLAPAPEPEPVPPPGPVLESQSKATQKAAVSSGPGRQSQPLQAPEVVEDAPPARAAFARALSGARVEAGISSRVLSDKIGKTPGDISTWERGKGLPGTREIAQALATTLDAPHLERLWHTADRERTTARTNALARAAKPKVQAKPVQATPPPAPAATPRPKEVTPSEPASAATAAEALQEAIRDGRKWFANGYDIHKQAGQNGAPDFYAAVPKGEPAEGDWVPVLRIVRERGNWQEIPLNPSGKARGA